MEVGGNLCCGHHISAEREVQNLTEPVRWLGTNQPMSLATPFENWLFSLHRRSIPVIENVLIRYVPQTESFLAAEAPRELDNALTRKRDVCPSHTSERYPEHHCPGILLYSIKKFLIHL